MEDFRTKINKRGDQMIKLGVNSVLFGGYDFDTAAKYIALSGYDGLEISAIKGMCEHLVPDDWRSQEKQLKETMEKYNLEFLATEVASLDEERLLKAFEAAQALGIPVVNVGPSGKSNNEEDMKQLVERLNRLAEKAEPYNISLCIKAHVGAVMFNTPSTTHIMDSVNSKAFGIDMDPSHIYRSGEQPEDALPKVINKVKHIHIRDCLGRQHGPGAPANQACGRGDIDLYSYLAVLTEHNYDGPVNLEVIGALNLSLAEVAIIAAESYGYLNACLKKLGAR